MGDFPTRISYDDASRIVERIASKRRLPHERLAIKRVDGRILAHDLTAPISLPPFDNSRMDGFALRHADMNPDGDTRLRIVGAQFAGPLLEQTLQPGECL